MSELEYRSAKVVDVSFPERTIELIVMPYEQEAQVNYHGREITEVCSRGAYDGIEAKNGRIRVNRDHDVKRTCGRAMVFHPSREEGLVAELRMSKTELGEESLVLADDGVLDASAEFGLLRTNNGSGPIIPRAEVWESRDRRRLNKLFLAGIALTPVPAYETASVLAVRTAGEPGERHSTPNLDAIRAWQLEQLYSAIRQH